MSHLCSSSFLLVSHILQENIIFKTNNNFDMKKTVLAVAMMLAFSASFAQKLGMEEFVTDLMSKMTLRKNWGSSIS